MTDLASIARAIREAGVTRIVHLAVLLIEDVRTDPLAATKVNVLGTNNVLEAARLFPDQLKRVVVTSSKMVYGQTSAYGPVTEDALLFPDSTCSAAKRYGEVLARTYHKEHHVPVISLRPTGVFGPFRRISPTLRKSSRSQP